MELLLSLKEEVPESLWNQFKSSVQVNIRILLFFTKNCALFFSRVRTLLNVHFNQTLTDADVFFFSHCVQFAACQLQENGITQLSLLSAVSQHDGVWTNQVLRGLLSGERLPTEQGEPPASPLALKSLTAERSRSCLLSLEYLITT